MTQEKRIRVIIWVSILMSLVLYVVIINLVKVEPKEIPFNRNIFFVLGGFFAILPYFIKKFNALQIFSPFGVIVAEISAIIGVAVYFAFADKALAYRLIAISFVSILFLFPFNKKENKTEKSDMEKPPPIE